MNKKEIFFISIIMIICMAGTANVVFNAMTGRSFISGFDDVKQRTKIVPLDKCTTKEETTGLNFSKNQYIAQLNLYQEYCDSYVTNQLMIFIEMPKDDLVAAEQAQNLAETLNEFSDFGVKPIVIIEPVSEWGLIDFEEFETGFYDEWIRTFFQTLKESGIDESEMGIWVPFPEANLPYWNQANAKPKDFAAIVNRYTHILREQYPQTHVSILLNSATYETTDFDWENGEYLSLLPYIRDIEPGLVDSLGLQGFPWTPPASRPGAGVYEAKEFLNHELAIEAAKALGVKTIWFNTGTYSQKYAQIPEDTIRIPANLRKDILTEIASEALKTKAAGFEVWVNFFVEDKSTTLEATNWSYIPDDGVNTNEDFSVISEVIALLDSNEIPISLSDK